MVYEKNERNAIVKKLLFLLLVLTFSLTASDMIIIRGADGTEEFSKPLDASVKKWQEIAAKAKISAILISGEQSKLQIDELLMKSTKDSVTPLWIVYVGHGTYLNQEAKLNLKGPDISAAELKKSLDQFKREVIFINCASASAPFIAQLSGKNRVVITATKSSQQVYYTKFNEFLADAMGHKDADIDKDSQTSLFESFLYASAEVKKYYEQDKRISGENAVIDDNGDKLGSLADMFDGLKPKKPNAKIDGLRAHQIHLIPSEEEAKMPLELRTRRNELERELNLLKLKKDSLSEDEYYEKLEVILKKLAEIYKEDS